MVGQFVADKADKRAMTVVLFVGQATAVLLYTMVSGTLAIYVVALLFGFTIGNVYMMMSLLTAEIFGILSFGTVYGVISLGGQLGSGVGLVFIGWAHDATDGYTVPFVVLAALNLVAAVDHHVRPAGAGAGGGAPTGQRRRRRRGRHRHGPHDLTARAPSRSPRRRTADDAKPCGMGDLLHSTDAEIEEYVPSGDPMTLRGLLFQLTGDPAVAATTVGEAPGMVAPVKALVDPQDIELVRAAAARYLRAHRDAGAPTVGPGPRERLPQSLGLAAGADIPTAAVEFCIEELGIERIPRRHELRHRPPERSEFHVVVIGSGVGGINAAINLKECGIPFTVLDKNDDVGGTWHDNTYPGCRVDVPSLAVLPQLRAALPVEPLVRAAAREQPLPAVVRRHVRGARSHPVLHRGHVP